MCLAGDAPSNDASVDTEAAFPSLPEMSSPTLILQAPGDNNRWYALEQQGRILRFVNSPSVSSFNVAADLTTLVNDNSNVGESGLLSMAFHPNFASNGDIFLFYQASESGGSCCVSRLSRFHSDDNGLTFNTASEDVLIEFANPYGLENHFGGHVAFDEDGLLYLTIGDGGSSGDPDNRAQNTSNLWGSMIRIDVDSGTPYSIPASNPFADEDDVLCNNETNMDAKELAAANCPEIFAWGLRNTWRWSFDSATGDIWAGDVGQGGWEEVDIIQLGGNYGWRIREGAHCYNPSNNCQTSGLIDPVAEVQHDIFSSITGGYMYRGSDIPSLVGRYVFGDYLAGRIYSLISDGDGGWEIDPLDNSTGFNISTFAEDQNSELYLVNYSGGAGQQVLRFIDNSGASPSDIPTLLSETGCVDASDPTQASSAMVPYSIHAPFWSDNALKSRWFALPNGESITVNGEQDWEFPVGSVLMKNFELNGELIETRLLKHHNNNTWAGYSYKWNEAGTDAELVVGGEVVEIDEQDWIYPSGGQCLECHTAAAGRTLGPETLQMNKDHTYPTTGNTANQITTLEAVTLLESGASNIALVDPTDTNASLEDRARSWLHTNCAQCHRPSGAGNINMDFRFTTAFDDMNICNVDGQNGDLGIPGAKRLVPGSPELSLIIERMSLRGSANQMPPLGTSITDDAGITLLSSWISSLGACSGESSALTPVSSLNEDFEGASGVLQQLYLFDEENPGGAAQSIASESGVSSTQTDGRYRGELTDNTGNRAHFYQSLQGRLDGVLVNFPFTVTARNAGIGSLGNSQTPPPLNNGSYYVLAGLQVHVVDFTEASYANLVVGYANSTTLRVEGKFTNNGTSVWDFDGIDEVTSGRADLRLVGDIDGNITAYWQLPNPNPGVDADNWILYDGNGAQSVAPGELPGTQPDFAGQALVGLVTYANNGVGVGYVGTADSLEITSP